MMEQYWQVKEQYKDELLFYRFGDFYEMFLTTRQWRHVSWTLS